MREYTKIELEEALRAISSTISKIEKVTMKETLGPSQKNLISRRLSALQIASELIAAKLMEVEQSEL